MVSGTFKYNGRGGQPRRTFRHRLAVPGVAAPLHDAGHVPGSNKLPHAGQVVLVQVGEIPAGNRATHTGNIAALSELPPCVF